MKIPVLLASTAISTIAAVKPGYYSDYGETIGKPIFTLENFSKFFQPLVEVFTDPSKLENYTFEMDDFKLTTQSRPSKINNSTTVRFLSIEVKDMFDLAYKLDCAVPDEFCSHYKLQYKEKYEPLSMYDFLHKIDYYAKPYDILFGTIYTISYKLTNLFLEKN